MIEGRPARRGRWVWGVAVTLAGAVALAIASPAAAVPPPPPNPSDQQIQAGEQQASSSAVEVGRLAGQVSTTQAKIQQLQDAMELKGELALKAMVDLQAAQYDAEQAQQDAVDAQQAADAAGDAIVSAKTAAADFAAASFRQGFVLGSATALLDADSLDQLLARKQMIEQVSGSQLGVLAVLQAARTNKANLDSKAKAALQAARTAQDKAQQAKQAADAAKVAAEQSFRDGQQQLAALQKQLDDQQAQYQNALNSVADLKSQRAQYNAWVQAKQVEDARLQEQATLQAAQARKALEDKQRADEQARQAAEAKNAAVGAEKTRQAKIAEKERREALKRAQEQAARDAAARNSAKNASQGASSGGSSSNAPAASPPSNLSRGQQVVQAALAWLGTPYAWGGGTASGPSRGIHDWGVADAYGDYNKIGFDCSGLALYAWAQVGVYLPHYSGYQYNYGKHVAASALQPGDLVFYAYNTSNPATIHHVAIYKGNNQIIEAPQSGSYVKISPMRWSGYIGATRPGT